VRQSNRLRAVLLRYYPAALTVFGSLSAKITLHFLSRYPTPQAAAGLSWSEFETFARQHRYPQPKRLAACFARLQQPQPKASAETIQVYHEQTPLLSAMLLQVVEAKRQSLKELTTLFEQHTDHFIFASLPGAGQFLAPALLSKFGDYRSVFPPPAACKPWPERVRSLTEAANAKRSSLE